MTDDDGEVTGLGSFPVGVRALVIGAGGGIGGALAAELACHPRVASLHVAARDPARMPFRIAIGPFMPLHSRADCATVSGCSPSWSGRTGIPPAHSP